MKKTHVKLDIYVMLIMYNQLNAITCLKCKCKVKLITFKKRKCYYIYIYIFVKSLSVFEICLDLGSNSILEKGQLPSWVPRSVSTKLENSLVWRP